MTPSEERALSALITSKNKKEAAQKAGITERTMRRYFESSEFCKRYREAFAQVVQDAHPAGAAAPSARIVYPGIGYGG